MDRDKKTLVKVMYSTEIGKLTEEMSRLVFSRVEEFENEVKDFKDVWQSLPFDNAVKLRDNLDYFRRELALLDTKLEDIHAIFEGSIAMSLPVKNEQQLITEESKDE